MPPSVAYPDAAHPVHQAVRKHRDWFLATITELFAETGKPDPEPAARHFVMLRDGAMAAGCLSRTPSVRRSCAGSKDSSSIAVV